MEMASESHWSCVLLALLHNIITMRLLSRIECSSSSFSSSSGSSFVNETQLRQLLAMLEPGGELKLVLMEEDSGAFDAHRSSTTTREKCDSALKIAGFEDVSVSSVVETRKVVCRGKKPTTWETGAKFLLKKKKTSETSVVEDAWTTTTKKNGGAEEAFIDEEALLTEEDLERPNKNGGCAPTRKPCKDCTCGRKEEEEEKQRRKDSSYEGGETLAQMDVNKVTTDTKKDEFKSACGNCALGDAFRCAGCPYLGQPAFNDKDEEGVVKLDVGGADV